MEDKIIFFTGATSGIGRVAACDMVSKGATVVCTYRNVSKVNELLKYYEGNYSEQLGEFDFIECNLNSFQSIENASAQFHAKYKTIDFLVLNAGIMNSSLKRSEDDIEQTLQINLLSPVLLIHLLIDKLSTSHTPKIIFTSSALHQGEVNFDDLEFKSKFSGFNSYRQSKLGVLLMTRYLSNLFKGSNIGVYAFHPGVIRTELGRDAGFVSKMIFYLMGKSAKKGAQTLNYLADTEMKDLECGAYYINNKVAKSSPMSNDLNVASNLNDVIKDYLYDHLSSSSLLYKY